MAAPPRPAAACNLDDALLRRAAHDIRASLRALRELPGWVSEDLAEAGVAAPGQVALSLELIQSHARRLENMLDGALAYLRLAAEPGATAELAGALGRVLDGTLLPAGTRLRPRIAAGLCVPMSGAQAEMLFRILVTNSLRHHPGPPSIRILARRRNGQAEILVGDDGPGIPQAQRDAACAPLGKLRSRDEDEGAGLGLAILGRLAEIHGGQLSLETPGSGRGLLVRITLPCTSSASAHRAAADLQQRI
ncbi:sensor histidine kinase KdpD [Mangrovicoccus sp. HB161399]|uniref:sensor histidine kinase n=1 Tax=Mangrovicoccus sp. HB161399 TaxID=2720392 RepID=UPI00155602AA|nr:sensor histidine kinase [Mangrovicoccus sp. HB161399]